MASETLFQQAVAAAHAGKELTARDLFLQVVRAEPRNEAAWMWLTGLHAGLDERIAACGKVLEINPGNSRVRAYLDTLLAERQKDQEAKERRAGEQLQQARESIKAKNQDQALAILRSLTAGYADSAEAWWLLEDLSPDIDEQRQAINRILELTPGDERAGRELRRIHYYQTNPLDLAAMYEEEGDFSRASAIYTRLAAAAKTTPEWNVIYTKVARLENLQQERIVHVSPILSVARLTAGPLLLYLALMLVQSGMNPFAYSKLFYWLGFPFVLLGGYLTALAVVRSRRRLWFMVFDDVSAENSGKTRTILEAAGWIMILLPHFLLILEAYLGIPLFFLLSTP